MIFVLFVCGILIALVISAGAVYLLLGRRRLPNRSTHPSIGLKNCPICGSRISTMPDMPYIILCENRNCPNSRYIQEQDEKREKIEIYSN
jgi:hypothetical protein